MGTLNINFSVPNAMTIDQAKGHIQKTLSRLEQEHSDIVTDVQEKWDGYICSFSLKARGSQINGKIVVGHNQVQVSAGLPFMASFFAGTITKMVTDAAGHEGLSLA